MVRSNRKEAIIDAAKDRFRRYGVRKTSMHEIAADCNLAVGTLYLYFENKDHLIVGCADDFGEKHRRQAAEILGSRLSPADKLRRYLLSRFRAVEDTRTAPHAAEIARAVIRLTPERFEEDDRWLHANVLAILKEGIGKGAFTIADPDGDAAVFLLAVKYFLPVAGLEPYQTPTETNMCRVIEWFLEKWAAADVPIETSDATSS